MPTLSALLNMGSLQVRVVPRRRDLTAEMIQLLCGDYAHNDPHRQVLIKRLQTKTTYVVAFEDKEETVQGVLAYTIRCNYNIAEVLVHCFAIRQDVGAVVSNIQSMLSIIDGDPAKTKEVATQVKEAASKLMRMAAPPPKGSTSSREEIFSK